MINALGQLTKVCALAGFGGETLGTGAEESLTNLNEYPAPLPALAANLRSLAAGKLAPIPDGLPKQLRELLEQIHTTVHASG